MLALVPAGFLVLLLLAGLAVDSAVAYQAQGQLHDALTGAANDAVAAGLDDRSFYESGALTLDPSAVASVVCRSVRAQDLGPLRHLRIGMAISGEWLRVTGTASVGAVFGRAVPGFGSRAISSLADATVSSRTGLGTPPRFGPATPISCGSTP